jgi:uncharacterized protein YgiM (DUF1202 family)
LTITVFPDNAIKAMFGRNKVATIESSPTPTVELKPTSTPEPTPVVTPTPTVAPTPTVIPDPNAPLTPLPVQGNIQTRTGYIVAPSGLVVRTGPSQDYKKLGTLPYGKKIDIIKQGDYHFIVFKDGGGYIHSKYVVISDTPPGSGN